MTKKELIGEIQEGIGNDVTKKQVGEIVDAVFGAIGDAIKKEGRYSHPGFGTFSVKTRAARSGRNPRTGEAIDIAESKSVSFKASPELKKSID